MTFVIARSRNFDALINITSEAVRRQCAASFHRRCTMSPTGILDLPTEILVDILERLNIPPTTFFNLALLCRKLHFIALPIFLARCGFNSSTNSIVMGVMDDRPDAISGLKTALFKPQPESICAIFAHPSCISIFPIVALLQRLENYISRLPSLKHVTLQLDIRGSACLSVGSEEGLRAWTTGMESLLNCIVRTQCTSLTMLYGSQFTRGTKFVLPPTPNQGTPTRLLSSISSLLCLRGSDNIDNSNRRAPEMALPLSLHASTKLTALEIHSAILLRGPGLNWTLTALRNCPVTSLTLGRLLEESIAWDSVLPLIASAATSLTSFKFLEADPFSAGYTDVLLEGHILEFISRLPLLHRLDISYIEISENRETDTPPTIQLPRLETLRAPARLIHHLLRNLNPIPKIRTIYVVWPNSYMAVMWPNRYPAVAINVLAPVLSAILQMEEVPQIVLSVNTRWDRHTAILTQPAVDVRKLLDRIDGLEILSRWVDVDVTAAWVQMLPRVRQVELSQSDPRDQGSRTQFCTDLPLLLQAVKPTACLREIKVDGEVHSLVGT